LYTGISEKTNTPSQTEAEKKGVDGEGEKAHQSYGENLNPEQYISLPGKRSGEKGADKPTLVRRPEQQRKREGLKRQFARKQKSVIRPIEMFIGAGHLVSGATLVDR